MNTALLVLSLFATSVAAREPIPTVEELLESYDVVPESENSMEASSDTKQKWLRFETLPKTAKISSVVAHAYNETSIVPAAVASKMSTSGETIVVTQPQKRTHGAQEQEVIHVEPAVLQPAPYRQPKLAKLETENRQQKQQIDFLMAEISKLKSMDAAALHAMQGKIATLKATNAEALHALEDKDTQALRAMEGNETQWKDEDEHEKSEDKGLVTEAKRLSAKFKKMVKRLKAVKAKAAEQTEKLAGKKHKWKTKAAEVAYKKHAMHDKKKKWKTKAAEVAYKKGGYKKYAKEQAEKLAVAKDQYKKLEDSTSAIRKKAELELYNKSRTKVKEAWLAKAKEQAMKKNKQLNVKDLRQQFPQLEAAVEKDKKKFAAVRVHGHELTQKQDHYSAESSSHNGSSGSR